MGLHGIPDILLEQEETGSDFGVPVCPVSDLDAGSNEEPADDAGEQGDDALADHADHEVDHGRSCQVGEHLVLKKEGTDLPRELEEAHQQGDIGDKAQNDALKHGYVLLCASPKAGGSVDLVVEWLAAKTRRPLPLGRQ